MPDRINEPQKEIDLAKVALARGIFFPTAEMFGTNLSGFWEYGPIGVRILNKVLLEWRKFLDQVDACEISGAVVLPRKVLQSSGHESNFTDPLVSCKKCKSVYRVDKMLDELNMPGKHEGLSQKEYDEIIAKNNLKCDKCKGDFGSVMNFSLMVGTRIGVSEDVNAYLRPEACQSIFLDFKRIFDTYSGKKLPLAIAQVGKAFRNEIAPRNSLIRQREFYQMDIEVFFVNGDEFLLSADDNISIGLSDEKNPGVTRIRISEAMDMRIIEERVSAYWTSRWVQFLTGIGFASEDIRIRKLYGEKPFYAKEAFDLEVKRDSEWIEVSGIHYRNDYDLAQYEKFGASVPKVEGKIPTIFEISCGLDRLIYMLLYTSMRTGERQLFSLKENIAPYRFGIFPLQKDEQLLNKARSIYKSLKDGGIDCYYSETGSIGKRYAKADEIGVPKCVTIDYTTLEDETVTVRDRDTTQQIRIKYSDVK